MKTLKHNLVIAMLAISIATVTASAKKNVKVAKGSVVRARILDLFSGSDFEQSGLADILFKLDDNKIIMIGVEGDNLKLNKQIKTWLETNNVFLNGQVGFYQVKINMNGAKVTGANEEVQRRLREMMQEVLNYSDINDNGEATIQFSVSNNKQLKILDVTGSSNYLSVPVKNMINQADISVPEGLKGRYEVNVTF